MIIILKNRFLMVFSINFSNSNNARNTFNLFLDLLSGFSSELLFDSQF